MAKQITTELLSEVWSMLSFVRKLRGLTQVQLAEAADITQGAISRIENGSLYPSDDNQKRMANELGLVTADHLFECLARCALHPDSLNDFSFGPRGLDEDASMMLSGFKMTRSGRGNPNLFKDLMQFRAYQLQRARDKEDNERMLEELEHKEAMGRVVDAEAHAKAKAQAIAQVEIHRKHDKEPHAQTVIGKGDHYVMKAETGKFMLDEQTVAERMEQGIGSLAPKRGRSLLTMERKRPKLQAKAALEFQKDQSSTIPFYNREGPNELRLRGTVTLDVPDAQVPTPSRLTGVDGAYAIETQNIDMVPRYSFGDTLYVSPKSSNETGDDVVIRFYQDEVQYAYVTTIREKKRFRDANGDIWQGYGCVRTLIEQENYQQLLTDTNDLDEDDWAKYEKGWLEWYLVPEDEKHLEDLEADSFIEGIGGKHWNNDIFFARAVDTVVGCERRLNFQRSVPTGPRPRRPVDDVVDGAEFFGGERYTY